MFTCKLQRRFPLVAALFFLIAAISFVGGCGREQQQDDPTPTSQDAAHQPYDHVNHVHDDHVHSDHAHGGHAHSSEDAATQPAGPVELDADAQAALDQVMASYLTVKQRLADDQMEGVQAELDELHDAAHLLFRSDAPGVEAKARAVAEPVHHEPADLDEARELFKSLSAAMVELAALVTPSDTAAPALYRAHCPMVNADWLQTSEQLANPYMGKAMLQCGMIQDVIKPADEG